MNPSDIELDGLLKRLHLAYTRHNYRAHIERAEKNDISYRDFLAELIAGEISHRHETHTQRFTRRARFPFLKTIDDFNFTHQTVLRPATLGSFLSADFVTAGRSLILCGKTGRGKTHLAVAIAYRAIQNGFEALFTTVAALIDELSRACREGRFQEALAHYTHPHVLVIDSCAGPVYVEWRRVSCSGARFTVA